MKGPYERLKYDLRRIWECPVCHHRERANGSITALFCSCQDKVDPLERVAMKLVEDRIQRRIPAVVRVHVPAASLPSEPIGPLVFDSVEEATFTASPTELDTEPSEE